MYESLLVGALLLCVLPLEIFARTNSEFNANVLSLERQLSEVGASSTSKLKTSMSSSVLQASAVRLIIHAAATLLVVLQAIEYG